MPADRTPAERPATPVERASRSSRSSRFDVAAAVLAEVAHELTLAAIFTAIGVAMLLAGRLLFGP